MKIKLEWLHNQLRGCQSAEAAIAAFWYYEYKTNMGTDPGMLGGLPAILSGAKVSEALKGETERMRLFRLSNNDVANLFKVACDIFFHARKVCHRNGSINEQGVQALRGWISGSGITGISEDGTEVLDATVAIHQVQEFTNSVVSASEKQKRSTWDEVYEWVWRFYSSLFTNISSLLVFGFHSLTVKDRELEYKSETVLAAEGSSTASTSVVEFERPKQSSSGSVQEMMNALHEISKLYSEKDKYFGNDTQLRDECTKVIKACIQLYVSEMEEELSRPQQSEVSYLGSIITGFTHAMGLSSSQGRGDNGR
jgi:hypothetical protein